MFLKATREEVVEKFSSLSVGGEWRDVGANQIQLRHATGGVVNWYSGSGKIVIQGKHFAITKLRAKVQEILDGNNTASAISVDVDRLIPVVTEIPAFAKEVVKENKVTPYESDFDSELVIGLVGAVGTDLDSVYKIIKERLSIFGYTTNEIKVSQDIISNIVNFKPEDSFDRINRLMTEGNNIRKNTGDFSVLGKAAAARISEFRTNANGEQEAAPLRRHAFVISSLKHPDEVQALRKIYSHGFFLIGVYADESRRRTYLEKNKDISPDNTTILINRDVDESEKFGQHTRDTYHLSDFFINYGGNNDRFQNDIWRTIDLIFGKPFVTPTFDEFAMFMAFSASLRSADLSRQVGAVVAKNNAIVATGGKRCS
jgi:hypothetical protein